MFHTLKKLGVFTLISLLSFLSAAAAVEESAAAAVEDSAAAEVGNSAAAEVGNKAAAEVGNKAAAEVGNKAAAEVGNKAAAEVRDKAATEIQNRKAAAEDPFRRLPTIKLKKFSEESSRITIDGILNEPAWQTVQYYDHLVVTEPDSLADTAYDTRYRFFYTDQGMYMGAAAQQPRETLIARLSSRDKFINRDRMAMTLDPSGEGLYGYWFDVHLGGTVSDGTALPERQFSNQWDGPWRGASAETDDGYAVEMFIPWSMMTLPEVEGDTRQMGLYVLRNVAHLGERWTWPALPFSQTRFMSALQTFEIENITPKKQFTFYPFASSTYDVIASEDDYKAGFDVYWRPSSNLQLTATVNPDFGNVESDDVVVNLTSFETFFPEKRPFFLEGQEIFQTSPRARSRGRGSPTILVHTRRIGSPPEPLANADLELYELEENQPSELQAAAKVTGQNGNWRYGVITAIEDDTKMEGSINGLDVDIQQDGRTFGAARFLYESTEGTGRKGLGWITTLVDHPDKEALVHGIDGHYLSAGGQWNVDGQLLYSDVDEESGSGGFVDIGYTPVRGVQHTLALDYFDEDLDINDFGFLRRNDAISARYRLNLTSSDLEHLKSRETSMSLSQEYNTDGQVVRSGIFFDQERTFKNNSFLFTEINYFPGRWDDLNSDGNGAFRVESRLQAGAFWASDNSRPLQFGFGFFRLEEEIGGHQNYWEIETNWRPSDRFSTSFFMAYRERTDWLLHESERDFTTYEATFWQPRLEIDYFISAKQQLKITTQWVGIKAYEGKRWKVPVSGGRLQPDIVDDEARDFSISRLVFQARYRWEIAPLSDLFVVYTRGSDVPSQPDEDFGHLLTEGWTDRAVDRLVIKLRYRLGS